MKNTSASPVVEGKEKDHLVKNDELNVPNTIAGCGYDLGSTWQVDQLWHENVVVEVGQEIESRMTLRVTVRGYHSVLARSLPNSA